MAAVGGGLAALLAGGDGGDFVEPFAVPPNVPWFRTPVALAGVPGNDVLTDKFNLMGELFNYAYQHVSEDAGSRKESVVEMDLESPQLKEYLSGVTMAAKEAAETMHDVFSAAQNVVVLPPELARAYKFFKMVWPPAKVNPVVAATVTNIKDAVDAAMLGVNPEDALRVVGFGPDGVVMEAVVPAVVEAGVPVVVVHNPAVVPRAGAGHGGQGGRRARRHARRLRSC